MNQFSGSLNQSSQSLAEEDLNFANTIKKAEMKSIAKITALLFGLLFSLQAFEQKGSQSFVVERIIPVPAAEVWRIVGDNFADIAKSHPQLSGSHYVANSPLSGEGCERICSLSADGEKYTHEKMIDYNPQDYSFKAEIIEAGGLPLETGASFMRYKVEPIDRQSCRLVLEMVYRTNPAFLGPLSKRKFRRNIEDYALAIQHHALTGEDVNPENFEAIKAQYDQA